jgi:hypothetical protein
VYDQNDRRIRRRVGSTPQERGSTQGVSCPDVFELENGDFAVIGTQSEEPELLPDAFVADGDTQIVIPRDVILAAMSDLMGSPRG